MSEKPINKSGTEDMTASTTWRSSRYLRAFALYLTMVTVSSIAIVWLEHATIFNALRTALVAAVGKSIAANWVIGIFE